MKTLELDEKYEIYLNYRTPEQGNWNGMTPGWNKVREDLSYEEMLRSKAFFEKNYQNQTVYNLPVKVVMITREVIDV